MGDLNVIDRFMETFIRYIDSGFGLLTGDVAFLTTILIAIDITLAGLFWAMDGESNIFGRLIKKILYVGVFALILNNFSMLADIVYRSFAGLGLQATANSLTAADLLKPGRLAGTGFEAAWPLLHQVGELMGFTSFFDNFLTIIVLLIAWAIVILAFFILAVQLFITILEFKLTTLAGFVLVPFALWNKTSFLAERVLGNVVSSGIKVMVLAVIVGIGSSFFGEFITALQGQDPFAAIGTRSVSVQVTSVVRASDASFQVKWTEQVYERGSLARTERWTAILTTVIQPPRSAEVLRKNPLGLYVNAIAWSRELDPATAPEGRMPQ